MTCKHCGKSFRGRTDKQYCSSVCKNAFHRQRYLDAKKHFKAVDHILHRNYNILSNLPWGNAKSLLFPEKELLALGFRPDYCTRLFVNKKRRHFLVLCNFAWSKMENEMIWIIRNLEQILPRP
jgi:hypothetical protein